MFNNIINSIVLNFNAVELLDPLRQSAFIFMFGFVSGCSDMTTLRRRSRKISLIDLSTLKKTISKVSLLSEKWKIQWEKSRDKPIHRATHDAGPLRSIENMVWVKTLEGIDVNNNKRWHMINHKKKKIIIEVGTRLIIKLLLTASVR